MHQQQAAFESIVVKGEVANIFDIVSFFGAEFEKPKNGISNVFNKLCVKVSLLRSIPTKL